MDNKNYQTNGMQDNSGLIYLRVNEGDCLQGIVTNALSLNGLASDNLGGSKLKISSAPCGDDYLISWRKTELDRS